MNTLRQFFARIRFSRQESVALATVFGLYMVGLGWRHVQKTAIPFDKQFYAQIDSVTGDNAMRILPVGMHAARDTVPKPKKPADSLGSDQGSGIGDQGSGIGDQGSGIGDQGSGIGDQGSGSSQHMATGRLNINLATARQLTLLPGIGPSLAQRIVAYREESGPFRYAGDLIKVKGIGPKTLKKFEGMIVTE